MSEKDVTIKTNPHNLSMDIDKAEFALALKTWRLRQNLTQKQVGDMWGCSRFTILRAENARDITWQMAYRLFNRLQQELIKEARNEIHNDN